MVIFNDNKADFSFPFIIAWCAHVTEIPEEIKMVEFNKGIS